MKYATQFLVVVLAVVAGNVLSRFIDVGMEKRADQAVSADAHSSEPVTGVSLQHPTNLPEVNLAEMTQVPIGGPDDSPRTKYLCSTENERGEVIHFECSVNWSGKPQ